MEHAAVALVLGSDDLLVEILRRVNSPTCLVRAAAVSKRWLRHASDPAFLRRFRARHPPRLLGFYVHENPLAELRFLPVSQDPELRSAVRRASYAVDNLGLLDCQNGRLLVRFYDEPSSFAVLSPLQGSPGMAVLTTPFGAGGRMGRLHLPPGMAVRAPSPDLYSVQLFMPNDGGHDGSVIAVEVLAEGMEARAGVHVLSGDVWKVVHDTASIKLPKPVSGIREILRPIDGKVYMVAEKGCKFILELDLATPRFSVIPLPDKVTTTLDNFRLSSGENGSGLVLVHAEGRLLSVWRHETNGAGAGAGWVLVHDKVPVREAFTRHQDVLVIAVSDGAEFVLLGLESRKVLMHVHLKSWTERVYDEMKPIPMYTIRAFPCMMVWPPVFPVLTEGNNQEY
ncbi:hypothetical protein EJB05_53875, partial [Eragrostis curvula]